jgi:hypothetical protein
MGSGVSTPTSDPSSKYDLLMAFGQRYPTLR